MFNRKTKYFWKPNITMSQKNENETKRFNFENIIWRFKYDIYRNTDIKTNSELFRRRKNCFAKILRNSFKTKFSIKKWRFIFRSKFWRNSYVKQNILVFTVLLISWLFHYEWKIQIQNTIDQIKKRLWSRIVRANEKRTIAFRRHSRFFIS